MSNFVTVSGGAIPDTGGLLPVLATESLPSPLQSLLVSLLEIKLFPGETYKPPVPASAGVYQVSPTLSNLFGLGTATVTATGTGSISGFIEGAGKIDFVNTSSSASTVLGTYASVTVSAGAGGGLYVGGPGALFLPSNNLLVGGTGSVTLVGGGSGDTLSASGPINLLAVGTGNETLIGTKASGANTFDLIGGGNDRVSTSGSGTQTFLLDSNGGHATITGSQAAGAVNTYQLSATGSGGGLDLITDYRIGTDHFSVTGATIAKVADAQTLANGAKGAIVTLSNGTTIQLANVSLATSVVGGSSF